MLFVCHPKILHKHCLQFLLGVKMAPRETENDTYAKFGVTNKVHYGIFWSGQFQGGLLRKSALCGGMDIFWNYTIKNKRLSKLGCHKNKL